MEHPPRADLKWKDVESLFRGLGAEVMEAEGSRIWVALNGVRAVFHKPHPRGELSRGAAKSVREYLIRCGVDAN